MSQVDALVIRQKQILLNALVLIRKEPPELEVGICPNIDYATLDIADADDSYITAVFREIAHRWPHYSGDVYYPVPSPYPDDTPRTAYWFAYTREGGMWDNEYGELRKQLLNFAIITLEQELNPK